jgi:hypothetical protein
LAAWWVIWAVLLNILNLLFESVDRAFYFYYELGDLGVGGFAGDGVGLAEHFLGDEIEFSAGLVGFVAALPELLQVRIEAGDFLGDVAAVGVYSELAGQHLGVQRYGCVGQKLVYSLGEFLLIFFYDELAACVYLSDILFDNLAAGLHIG